MLQLLGPKGTSDGEVARGLETGQAARGTSVEDFPPLLTENYLRRSTHATAARMRARLFQVCTPDPVQVTVARGFDGAGAST